MATKEFTHIDDWLESAVASRDEAVRYAAFFLHHKRLSASAQMAFRPFVGQHKLFCTYEGKRYRVTGASRLGDVWLHPDLMAENGYEHRVDVTDCGAWGSEP